MTAGSALAAFIALGAAGWHFRWQLEHWRPEDQGSALAVFRSNRDFGLLAFAAALLSGLTFF